MDERRGSLEFLPRKCEQDETASRCVLPGGTQSPMGSRAHVVQHFGQLEPNVGDVVNEQDEKSDFVVPERERRTEAEMNTAQFVRSRSLPGCVRDEDQRHGENMVQKHDIVILALPIHVERGVDGMQIEAALEEIHHLNVKWNGHAGRPI